MTNREVKNMRRACGKKCFYDEKLKYPVCKPKTCKIDKRRLKRAFKKRTQTRKHKKISENNNKTSSITKSKPKSKSRKINWYFSYNERFIYNWKKTSFRTEPPLYNQLGFKRKRRLEINVTMPLNALKN